MRLTHIGSAIAVTALTLGTSAVLAAPAHAAPARTTLTLTAAKAVVEKGKKVTLTGKLTSTRTVKGLTVTIQQRKTGGKWKKAGTATVRKGGKFTWSDKPSTATKRSYRAVLPRSKKFKAATSTRTDVAVAVWKTIAGMKRGGSSFLYPDTSAVNDVEYPQSLKTYFYEGYGEGVVSYQEVNLFRNCFTVRTALALDDSTTSGTVATGRIKVDNTEKAAASVSTLGTKEDLSVNVTGAFRVRFEIDLPYGDSRPVAAYLSPTFLCTTA